MAPADRGARPGRSRTPPGPGSSWLGRIHPAWWGAAAAALIYARSLGFGFVHDDHYLIEGNPLVRDPGKLGLLLTSDFWAMTGQRSGIWRPLVLLSMWIDGRLFQWRPAGFHLVNVLAHSADTALLAWCMTQSGLSRGVTLVSVLWFATMPVHLESVAWIAGRTDLLCALFLLLALALDRRARRDGRPWPGVAAPLAYALALLSKENAIPGIGLFAVAEWVERREPGGDVKRWLAWLLPYLVVEASYLLLHAHWTRGAAVPSYVDPRVVTRFRWAAWEMLPMYLATLWTWHPHPPDRTLPLPAHPWGLETSLGAALQVAFVVALVALVMRRSRWALPVALIWLPLLPTFALALTLGYVTNGERVIYVPSAGAAWVLGTMMEGILAWAARDRSPASTGTIRRAAWTLSTLWVLGSASEAIRLMPIWRDDGTMFRAMTLIEPSNPRGWVGWSSWLGREGRDSEALRGLAIAESLDARYPELYVVRGKIQAQRDEWPLALASAQRALALDSLRRSASVLEVIALLHLGRFDEAEIRLRPMMAREPGEPRGESLWGQLLAARGRDAEALPYLTRAAQRLTDDAGLAFTLGMVQLKLYRPLEARRALEKAIELAPEFYDGWIRLATACLLSGDRTGCERALDRAATLPGARDGRVERLRAALAAAPR